MNELVSELQKSPLHRFSNWPCKDLPKVASGVYVIYDQHDVFIYAGMAGAGLSESQAKLKKKSGLYDRLGSHATGYRSGDRFNIYIGDLFVLPTLTKIQIRQISRREITFDSLIRTFIQENLSYRYLITSHTIVRPLETHLQQHGIDGVLPTINPKRKHSNGASSPQKSKSVAIQPR